nr:hypothetical protein [Streptomyces sp. MBT84]
MGTRGSVMMASAAARAAGAEDLFDVQNSVGEGGRRGGEEGAEAARSESQPECPAGARDPSSERVADDACDLGLLTGGEGEVDHRVGEDLLPVRFGEVPVEDPVPVHERGQIRRGRLVVELEPLSCGARVEDGPLSRLFNTRHRHPVYRA